MQVLRRQTQRAGIIVAVGFVLLFLGFLIK
jgi:hypothetical protein